MNVHVCHMHNTMKKPLCQLALILMLCVTISAFAADPIVLTDCSKASSSICRCSPN